MLDLFRDRLSLRKLLVLLKALPVDSATARTQPDWHAWRLEHFLLDDLRMVADAARGVKQPKPHPSRPGNKKRTRRLGPERKRKILDGQRRAAERRRRLAAQELLAAGDAPHL